MSNVAHTRTPKQPPARGAGRRQVALPGATRQKSDGGVRGGLLLLGLALVVASGGAFWYILRGLDVREEYLVTTRTIQRWEIAELSDFGIVEANIGDAAGVPPQFAEVMVGRWATGRIPTGTLVTPGMFQQPPLSGEEDADKVLIEVSLPTGEAPGGELSTGDKIALFGAEATGDEFAEPSVGLIGVLDLDFVRGQDITYVVTPAEAKAIQEVVDRYTAASDRRIWKLGFELPTQELIDLYGSVNATRAPDDVFAEPGPILPSGEGVSP
ncbi:MAG: hypothetical protein OXI26_00070 [bacterium]|nr:hypothetical protein [bacterium]